MKTILTTLLLLCLITTQSISQWEWQNPRPHGNANNRLAFGDNPNTYSIVGNAGIIIKTTDDGVNWESQNSGTDVDLSDIYISGDNAIAVGESGTIRRTTDGGNTLDTISSGTTTNLTAVTFHTSKVGIITGLDGLVLRTINSGLSWNSGSITHDPKTLRYFICRCIITELLLVMVEWFLKRPTAENPGICKQAELYNLFMMSLI